MNREEDNAMTDIFEDEYLKTHPGTQLSFEGKHRDKIDLKYYLGVAFGILYAMTVITLIVVGVAKNSTPIELAAIALLLIPLSGLLQN